MISKASFSFNTVIYEPFQSLGKHSLSCAAAAPWISRLN